MTATRDSQMWLPRGTAKFDSYEWQPMEIATMVSQVIMPRVTAFKIAWRVSQLWQPGATATWDSQLGQSVGTARTNRLLTQTPETAARDCYLRQPQAVQRATRNNKFRKPGTWDSYKEQLSEIASRLRQPGGRTRRDSSEDAVLLTLIVCVPGGLAAQQGIKYIIIRNTDTKVVVLALSVLGKERERERMKIALFENSYMMHYIV